MIRWICLLTWLLVWGSTLSAAAALPERSHLPPQVSRPTQASSDMTLPGSVWAGPGPGIDPAGIGSFGVGLKAGVTVTRRGLPSFAVDAFYPALSDGSFDYSEGPYPAIVLIQGGAVPVPEYHFLAERWASWGFVVVLPYYPRDLAFYGPTRATDTVDWLEKTSRGETFWTGGLALSEVAVGGHSLGGVVADSAADGDARFTLLFLLASYPGDDDGNLLNLPVLTVGGSADCAATPDEVAAGYDTYERPRAYAEIEGMTHYQFTATDEEDLEACPPGISLETAHARLSSVMVPFFRWILAGDASLNAAIQQPAAGVTVELDW